MASSRAALWAAAVDGGFSKGEAFVSQMPDGKNPENPGFSWALEFCLAFVVPCCVASIELQPTIGIKRKSSSLLPFTLNFPVDQFILLSIS